jgi:hypothetical protein
MAAPFNCRINVLELGGLANLAMLVTLQYNPAEVR